MNTLAHTAGTACSVDHPLDESGRVYAFTFAYLSYAYFYFYFPLAGGS